MHPSQQPSTEFIKLLTNHQTALRGYIISLLPGCQDVNDVLQDTNVVLWEKMHSFEAGSNFQAWAFTIARNKVMQYWGQQKKLKRISLSESILDAIAEARKESRPELLENKLQALQSCLKILKQDERNLLHARYEQTESLQSYANKIGRSSASTRVSLHRIRQKLRSCVDLRLQWKGDTA
ncbi:sigma-70 family RNA polymerase sigma factor [Verrucomicrobiaceae bacterium N1E253]|uniref:Sigma-70 family RNA polymerase sigma factor n=1 Tax=Oceaniferula marina TaxID=2748318 RepID=A0A851GGP4_9BACT|nr:sigma-70 family RNA polymerase sigma factor [Oceaniferula marina]NWK55011.1 sigma-70 family RNA polymerase sigma factor [Oceaniferula marina]